jgi:transcriptional regulator with XRE-family HTH domain
MRDPDEKQGFARRLKEALKRSPTKVETPTELAAQFSVRYPDLSISMQAAQKWLSGQAMPAPDKIDALAGWLKVDKQWLRHGVAAQSRPAYGKTSSVLLREPHPPTQAEWTLLERLRRLPEARRHLVEEIVEQFALDADVWKQS